MSYEILAGSPTLTFGKEKSSGKMNILMRQSFLPKFIADAMPPPYMTNGEDGKKKKVYPLGAPMPNYGFLFCTGVSVSPFPSDLPLGHSVSGYPMVQCSVSYSTPDEDKDEEEEDAETVLTHSYDVGGEFLTIPSTGLKWEGEANAVKNEDMQAGKIIPQIEHGIGWERVAKVPFAAIRSCIGCVNSGSFFGAAKETLLFVGASITKTVNTDGETEWKVDYKFSERVVNSGSKQLGWNHFYRPDKGEWQKLKTMKTGDNIYKGESFTSLFK